MRAVRSAHHVLADPHSDASAVEPVDEDTTPRVNHHSPWAPSTIDM